MDLRWNIPGLWVSVPIHILLRFMLRDSPRLAEFVRISVTVWSDGAPLPSTCGRHRRPASGKTSSNTKSRRRRSRDTGRFSRNRLREKSVRAGRNPSLATGGPAGPSRWRGCPVGEEGGEFVQKSAGGASDVDGSILLWTRGRSRRPTNRAPICRNLVRFHVHT